MNQFTLIILFLFIISSIWPDITNNNELSSYISLFEIDSSQRYHFGFNFKPELDIQFYNSDSFFVDSEFIWNAYYNNYTNDRRKIERNKIKFYRGWLRLASDQSELRIGRQKINFGPALLLRSLRWFDRIDPRDPQQNTSGVDGILARHYFLNSSNFWLWILRSSSTLKGNEFLPSEEDALEYGFRIEYPFTYCESGLTFHMRQLDIDDNTEVKESRWGFDARWDTFIGYWLELSLGLFQEHPLLPEYEKSLTLGADYTINWQNGLYILVEHSIHSFSNSEIFSSYSENNISAVDIEYPLSFFSGIKTILFYSWNKRDFAGSLIYNHSLNYLDLFLSLNFNPYSDVQDYDQVSYDGISLQFKAVYNFSFIK